MRKETTQHCTGGADWTLPLQYVKRGSKHKSQPMKRKRKEKPQYCQGGSRRTLPWQDVNENNKRDK